MGQPSAFQHALATFKTKVDRKLVAEFEIATLSELKLSLASIQRKHASERRVRNMGRLSRFLDAMDQYGKVIEVFLNVTDVLAFVWGPMKFLLQIANTYSEAFGKLLETYQVIGESLPLLDKCQGFLENTPYVRQALESIFHDILEFHEYALGYFRKPMWQRVFQATWATYKTRFQPIVDNLHRHKDLLEGRVTFTQLETIISNGEKALHEFKRQQKDHELLEYRAVQAWLGNVDVETDHESIAQVRHDSPDAGSWLLQNPLFQPWQDATSDALLLWLNGIPGAGKSVLASLIIDKLRQKASNVTIWFYCRHGDKNRSSFIALARALISQLLKHDMDLMPYVHEKMSSRSEQMLTWEALAKELLEVLLKNSQGLYIILDGLDECARGEEKKIIEWFCSVLETSTLSAKTSHSPRCVFISQRDAITTKFLRDLPTIAITSSDNLHDIRTFVSSWGMKIQEKFGISVDDTKSMNEIVIKKSAGMFLFAKLVMIALFSQISREKLYNELKVKGIPDGLEAAYSRILNVVLDQASKSEALHLLAWLVCAKRPLRWREIQAAVAIDIEGETVDFYGRQWMVNAKDLCGSLVETRSDGSLELVHTTAKFYLVEKGVINVCHEELKIACLCLGYLALPGFETFLAESSVEDALKIGYYAFVDYAACYWTSHLRAGLARGAPRQYTGIHIGHLERFLDSHYQPRAEDIQIPVATRTMLSCLQELEDSSFDRFEEFLKVFVATERQVETYGEDAASNMMLDIPDIIKRIRSVLEDTIRRKYWDEVDQRLFSFFYGEAIYKCPRMSCSYFHHGFVSPNEREAHTRKHTLPYSCSYPGCLRAALGFSSQSELQKHILQTHEIAQHKAQRFPPRQKRPLLQCGICQQSFSKPGQLRTHDCRSLHYRNNDAMPGPLSQSFGPMTHGEQKQGSQSELNTQACSNITTSPVAQDHPQMDMGINDPSQQNSTQRQQQQEAKEAQRAMQLAVEEQRLQQQTQDQRSQQEPQQAKLERPQHQDATSIMASIAQDLSDQPQLGGWKDDVPIKTRARNIYQIITALRLIQPRIDLQPAAQVAASFERKVFNKASERRDYENECNEKLLHINGTRHRQELARLQQNEMPRPSTPAMQNQYPAGSPPQINPNTQGLLTEQGQPQIIMDMEGFDQQASIEQINQLQQLQEERRELKLQEQRQEQKLSEHQLELHNLEQQNEQLSRQEQVERQVPYLSVVLRQQEGDYADFNRFRGTGL